MDPAVVVPARGNVATVGRSSIETATLGQRVLAAASHRSSPGSGLQGHCHIMLSISVLAGAHKFRRMRGVSLLKATAEPTVVDVDAKDTDRVKSDLPGVTGVAAVPEVPLVCPVCRKGLDMAANGSTCRRCRLVFAWQADGSFTDFTITSAWAVEDAPPPQTPKPDDLAEGILQRFPFVKQADALAGALGLPQSRQIEALGRELLKEPQRLLTPLQPVGTSTFQSPLVSFAYERGWRQNFASSGFPGPDEEFRLAQKFLLEADGIKGDVLLDASCGSGLFSRRFASSGAYSTVVALDYSEAMLRQVNDFSRQELGENYAERAPARAALKLVRADISRLPFASDSLAGVHAGAAIHCWPSPENALAEVARVLRPGGVFVLTTFRPRGPLMALGRSGNNTYRFWEEAELRKLTRQCGLLDFTSIKRDPAFIMVRVRKPHE